MLNVLNFEVGSTLAPLHVAAGNNVRQSSKYATFIFFRGLKRQNGARAEF
jgi:hypothetical protein